MQQNALPLVVLGRVPPRRTDIRAADRCADGESGPSRIRIRFLWFVQPYTAKNRQWACCPDCSGVDFKARRLSNLTGEEFTNYSLTQMRCCPYEKVHFGPTAGGFDKSSPDARKRGFI